MGDSAILAAFGTYDHVMSSELTEALKKTCVFPEAAKTAINDFLVSKGLENPEKKYILTPIPDFNLGMFELFPESETMFCCIWQISTSKKVLKSNSFYEISLLLTDALHEVTQAGLLPSRCRIENPPKEIAIIPNYENARNFYCLKSEAEELKRRFSSYKTIPTNTPAS